MEPSPIVSVKETVRLLGWVSHIVTVTVCPVTGQVYKEMSQTVTETLRELCWVSPTVTVRVCAITYQLRKELSQTVTITETVIEFAWVGVTYHH